jgi:hypothetical protein
VALAASSGDSHLVAIASAESDRAIRTTCTCGRSAGGRASKVRACATGTGPATFVREALANLSKLRRISIGYYGGSAANTRECAVVNCTCSAHAAQRRSISMRAAKAADTNLRARVRACRFLGAALRVRRTRTSGPSRRSPIAALIMSSALSSTRRPFTSTTSDSAFLSNSHRYGPVEPSRRLMHRWFVRS